jgi:hypothetical protein
VQASSSEEHSAEPLLLPAVSVGVGGAAGEGVLLDVGGMVRGVLDNGAMGGVVGSGIWPVPGGKEVRPSIASAVRAVRSVVIVRVMEVIAELVGVVEDEVVDSFSVSSVSGMLSGDGNRSGVSQAGTAPRGTTIVPAELTRTGVATPLMVIIRRRRVSVGIDGSWLCRSAGTFSLTKVADWVGSSGLVTTTVWAVLVGVAGGASVTGVRVTVDAAMGSVAGGTVGATMMGMPDELGTMPLGPVAVMDVGIRGLLLVLGLLVPLELVLVVPILGVLGPLALGELILLELAFVV